ncbi:MAG: orotate phosphoribosyltransferase [Bacteroidales bacterium]|jgi:orotate phosphoribosyltransferase|nr:orotate phosphoribosyltransferase [Bacteroidales bacterium]MDD2204006.1 orotate phosphoribosyltransferase [Bacteroidales bacterium]MDD3151406.1 orotate phosphoribosyltransferase [Bacteroidales bacterium]MDD3913405.1 orotate phosphoribosyltransferase [Bacteroidales bacterium]MDD4633201.1 orotate phosphoribosyltransferase [Bacteroidales bacterium]
MIHDKETASNVANKLLEIKAVKLNPKNPYTWASGIISPIYCDNRKTLSFPEVRNYIKDSMAKIIKEKYSDVEVIAGVATGAIAIGVLVAEALNLPFIYIRSSQKDHGLQNKIEGYYEQGQKVVIIEDLISTGMSSLAAYSALKEANMVVEGMLAIYTYGLPIAKQQFEDAKCELTTLTDYDTTISVAVSKSYVDTEETETLKEWRKDPANWHNSTTN